MAAHPSVPSPTAAADEMDRMHEAGIKAFPAKTAGIGNQLLAPRMVGGVKVFELTASKIQWETSPGVKVDAFAYNDQVPGPRIEVAEGDRVRVVLKNNLPESTAIHFHGLELVNSTDGVPFITQPPVKPGTSFTYEFTVPNSGTHMYHSHHNSTKQVGMGLLGAFLVTPKEPTELERADGAPCHERYDVIVNCDNPGTWALHCHTLPHAESDHGMLGMVTALIVQK